LGQFSKKYRSFYQKYCQKALKNMVLGSGIRDPRSGIRDPGSGIRKKPIPDPGSRGQKGTGSRFRIRNNVEYHRLVEVPKPFYFLLIPSYWTGKGSRVPYHRLVEIPKPFYLFLIPFYWTGKGSRVPQVSRSTKTILLLPNPLLLDRKGI
jgi:hypothetical protein